MTLHAMCLMWRRTNIQVFLVTPICQHFLVAIVMGFSFIKTWWIGQCGLLLGSLERWGYELHLNCSWIHCCRFPLSSTPPVFSFPFSSTGTSPFQFYFSMIWYRVKEWKGNTEGKNKGGKYQEKSLHKCLNNKALLKCTKNKVVLFYFFFFFF